MTCKTCSYSAVSLSTESAQSGKLLCRAQPPIPAAIPVPQPGGISIQVVTLWPVVERSDICGAYEPTQPLNS